MIRCSYARCAVLAICLAVAMTHECKADNSVGQAEACSLTSTAGAAVTGGIIGDWVGAVVGGGCWGTVELGLYLAKTIGDPPDTENCAVRADPPLLIPVFGPPGVPVSQALIDAAELVIVDMSVMVQQARGVRMSLDRLAGAKIACTPTDVANQQQWLREFQLGLQAAAIQASMDLETYRAVLAVDVPEASNTEVSASLLRETRDNEASGVFGPDEQTVIAAWQLTQDELTAIQNFVGSITDDIINGAAPMIMDDALACISSTLADWPASACATCQLYADVSPIDGDCIVEVGDVLCILAGYAGSGCLHADIAPCGGDGIIEVSDVLAVLAAYAGNYACSHPCPP